MQVDEKRRLSVWLLPDGDDRADQLRRTIIALTIKSGHCEKFEFALVDAQILDELGMTALSTPGKTIDPRVNHSHRDIEDPGVEKIAALTLRFTPQDAVREREVGQMIADSVMAGRLERARLPTNIETKLVKWGYLQTQA